MGSQRIQVSREIAQRAAEWMLLLSAEAVKPEDEQACCRWRESSAEHEEAWQRVLQIQSKLGAVPKALSVPTLGRTERVSRRQFVHTLGLMIVVGPAAYLGYQHLPWQGLVTEYSTGVGRRKSFTLEDGTQLQLNTDSWVDVSFSQSQRVIRLHHGEIFISSAKDPLRRPLRVLTSHGEVRPIGTAFNVRQLRGSDQTDVAVVEGAVELHLSERSPVRLEAGYRSRFNTVQLVPSRPDNGSGSSWVKGVLMAEDMPLAELLTELGRYRQGWLRCDPAVAQLKVSGAFQLHDTNQILLSLQHSLPVEVVFRTDYWVSVLPRHN